MEPSRREGDTARAVRRARLVLGAGVAGLLVALAVLPKPWSLESGPGFPSPSGRPLFDTIAASLWWVALANAVLGVVLLASARLWARPLLDAPPPAAPTRLGRRGWALLVASALVAVGLRLPLAQGSLWWDEAWSVRRVVVGEVSVDAEGAWRVERPPWSRPFWDYRKPTNHVLYNVLARGLTDAWRSVRGAPPWAFDELVFRAPSLAASAAAVVGLGVLLARWGLPQAAVAGAFLLAIHPWFVRYGAEGRAYGLVVALTVALGLALTEALRRGTWPAWIGVGASSFLLLWAQPSAVYLVATTGLLAALAVLRTKVPWRDRATRILRLAVVLLVAGMALLQVMAPNVAQALAWTDVFQEEDRIYRAVLEDLWGQLATGIQTPTVAEADPAEAFPTLHLLAAERPWLPLVVELVLPLLALVGAARLAIRRDAARVVIAAVAGGTALALTLTWIQHMYYYHRFVIYAVVPVVACLAVGATTLLEWAFRRRRAAVAAGLVVLLAAYQALVWPQTRVLLTRSIAPMREAAEFARAHAADDASPVVRAGIGLGGEMPAIYDPALRFVETDAQFLALLDEVERRRAALYVIYAYAGQNRPRLPGTFALLDEPGRFQTLAEFRGVEPPLHYRVLRRPAGADGGDGAPPAAP